LSWCEKTTKRITFDKFLELTDFPDDDSSTDRDDITKSKEFHSAFKKSLLNTKKKLIDIYQLQ
jgi:hypothetical protein